MIFNNILSLTLNLILLHELSYYLPLLIFGLDLDKHASRMDPNREHYEYRKITDREEAIQIIAFIWAYAIRRKWLLDRSSNNNNAPALLILRRLLVLRDRLTKWDLSKPIYLSEIEDDFLKQAQKWWTDHS